MQLNYTLLKIITKNNISNIAQTLKEKCSITITFKLFDIYIN
jgi:zona occludens toxin (predicted ATPase)